MILMFAKNFEKEAALTRTESIFIFRITGATEILPNKVWVKNSVVDAWWTMLP